MVARTEIDPADMTPEAMQAAAVRLVAAADRTSEALDAIVAAVREAAAQLDVVDLHTVEGDAAGQAAQALASSLLRLTQLRQSLVMRRPRPVDLRCFASNVHSILSMLKVCPPSQPSRKSGTSGSVATATTHQSAQGW